MSTLKKSDVILYDTTSFRGWLTVSHAHCFTFMLLIAGNLESFLAKDFSFAFNHTHFVFSFYFWISRNVCAFWSWTEWHFKRQLVKCIGNIIIIKATKFLWMTNTLLSDIHDLYLSQFKFRTFCEWLTSFVRTYFLNFSSYVTHTWRCIFEKKSKQTTLLKAILAVA